VPPTNPAARSRIIQPKASSPSASSRCKSLTGKDLPASLPLAPLARIQRREVIADVHPAFCFEALGKRTCGRI